LKGIFYILSHLIFFRLKVSVLRHSWEAQIAIAHGGKIISEYVYVVSMPRKIRVLCREARHGKPIFEQTIIFSTSETHDHETTIMRQRLSTHSKNPEKRSSRCTNKLFLF